MTMSGQPVTVELGGKTREIRFDLNALVAIEDTLGCDLVDKGTGGVPLTLKAVRVILWAGLRHEEPGLTEEHVGGWVDQSNLVTVVERVKASLESALGGNAAGAPSGTGTRPSGRRTARSTSSRKNSGG